MITKRETGALLRVLLVEDNPAHAELILRSLEDHKIPSNLYHAPDGEAALDYLFQRGEFSDPVANPQPHIILLDIRMPKIDGLTVLKEVKTSPELRHIPIIILTTSNNRHDVMSAYANYVNSYLVKPVDFESFTQLMNEISLYWLNWNYHLD